MSDVGVNWFEIPVTDLARAAAFYAAVLDRELVDIEGPGGPIKAFMGAQGPAGSLTTGDNAPSATGIRIFLNCPDLKGALGRVAAAGGKVLQEKTPIPPNGFIGRLQDTEGNQVSLHSSE